MIAELGHFSLALACVLALTQIGLAAFAARAGNPNLLRAAVRAAFLQPFLLGLAFGLLIACFIRSDFSIALVAAHSHSAKPLVYKIAASWGNHEGSILLWSFFLALANALPAISRRLPPSLLARMLTVQGLMASAFLIYILAASNPFLRLWPAPFQGFGLNPVLQDPALALHPPILYAGYVGFSIAFAFAAAALLEKRPVSEWVHFARPWIIAAWSALTAGIALGAWWAYRELGWGGFWFWDPVENAALMPWLAGTALIHASAVTAKRGSGALMTSFLALTAFSLSMLGTFLTRSGILISVHSFASDPTRGLAILLIIGFLCGGAFLLFALRAPMMARRRYFTPLAREGALLLNSLVLLTITASVLTGTLYPVFAEIFAGEQISVGAPYFNATFLPLIAPLLLLVPLAPFLNWRRANLTQAARALLWPGVFALFAALAIFAAGWRSILGVGGLLLGLWILAGAFKRLLVWRRHEFGMNFAHAGLGVMILGIAGVSVWQQEHHASLAPGEGVSFAGYEISLEEVAPQQGADYRAEQARLTISENGGIVAQLTPESRTYAARPQPVREAAIKTFLLPPADLYAVMGAADGSARTFTFYYNPLAVFIWGGAALAALGGILALVFRQRAVVLALLLLLSPAAAFALTPEQEESARAVIASLHCPTCQGQPLAQSEAPLAVSLRRLVREKIAAGERPEDIIRFATERYGQVILTRPPLASAALPLWLAPFVFVLLAAAGAGVFIYRNRGNE